MGATRKLTVRESFGSQSNYVDTIQKGEFVEVAETKRKFPLSKTKKDTRVRIVGRTTLNGKRLPMEGWTDLTCWDHSVKAVVEFMTTIEEAVRAPEPTKKEQEEPLSVPEKVRRSGSKSVAAHRRARKRQRNTKTSRKRVNL